MKPIQLSLHKRRNILHANLFQCIDKLVWISYRIIETPYSNHGSHRKSPTPLTYDFIYYYNQINNRRRLFVVF